MSKVFVLDTNKQPLNPVHPGRARMLLSQGKAAVFRRYPFTVILKQEVLNPKIEPLRVKIDPGAKTTGLASRSRGGSNRVSNLCLACTPCNQKKGNQGIKDFIIGKPDLLKRILAQAKRPLADWRYSRELRYIRLVYSGGLHEEER